MLARLAFVGGRVVRRVTTHRRACASASAAPADREAAQAALDRLLMPAVVLARPVFAGNIGGAARAMANCGLREMRVVRPPAVDGEPPWREGDARMFAKCGMRVLERAGEFATVREAVADAHFVVALTARLRANAVVTPNIEHVMQEVLTRALDGQRTVLLFGNETVGLENCELDDAHCMLQIPHLDPESRSLNLAQAVLLVAYKWAEALGKYRAAHGVAPLVGRSTTCARDWNEVRGVPVEQVSHFARMLESLLERVDPGGTSRVPHEPEGGVRAAGADDEEAPSGRYDVHMLKRLLLRAVVTRREVSALYHIVRSLDDALTARGLPQPPPPPPSAA